MKNNLKILKNSRKNKENWLKKNKNIKNNAKKCGRLFFLHSRFSKIFLDPQL